MFDIFQNTFRPKADLFFSRNDAEDVRMGEIISFLPKDYEAAKIVILGCPQDEGVARNKGRIGAASAPNAIREQFYKLTDFEISLPIFDLGDTIIQNTLETTHDLHTKIVENLLRDGKILIILGGGNDVSYADGAAMAQVFGNENWSALNIDAHLDIRSNKPRNSGTPYRQLLEEKLLKPRNFAEIAFQSQAISPVHFRYLQNLEVKTLSLDEIQESKLDICELVSKKTALFDLQLPTFFGFDADSVRSSDAPGVSAPSPIGLTAENLINLAGFAGSLKETKIIEFTEVNPNFDIDNRTTKLIGIAMHKFCREQNKKANQF